MSGICAKYHVQIILLIVYTTTLKRFVIFTCSYFKLSWNTTALSQSNCRNFSYGSIIADRNKEFKTHFVQCSYRFAALLFPSNPKAKLSPFLSCLLPFSVVVISIQKLEYFSVKLTWLDAVFSRHTLHLWISYTKKNRSLLSV